MQIVLHGVIFFWCTFTRIVTGSKLVTAILVALSLDIIHNQDDIAISLKSKKVLLCSASCCLISVNRLKLKETFIDRYYFKMSSNKNNVSKHSKKRDALLRAKELEIKLRFMQQEEELKQKFEEMERERERKQLERQRKLLETERELSVANALAEIYAKESSSELPAVYEPARKKTQTLDSAGRSSSEIDEQVTSSNSFTGRGSTDTTPRDSLRSSSGNTSSNGAESIAQQTLQNALLPANSSNAVHPDTTVYTYSGLNEHGKVAYVPMNKRTVLPRAQISQSADNSIANARCNDGENGTEEGSINGEVLVLSEIKSDCDDKDIKQESESPDAEAMTYVTDDRSIDGAAGGSSLVAGSPVDLELEYDDEDTKDVMDITESANTDDDWSAPPVLEREQLGLDYCQSFSVQALPECDTWSAESNLNLECSTHGSLLESETTQEKVWAENKRHSAGLGQKLCSPIKDVVVSLEDCMSPLAKGGPSRLVGSSPKKRCYRKRKSRGTNNESQISTVVSQGSSADRRLRMRSKRKRYNDVNSDDDDDDNDDKNAGRPKQQKPPAKRFTKTKTGGKAKRAMKSDIDQAKSYPCFKKAQKHYTQLTPYCHYCGSTTPQQQRHYKRHHGNESLVKAQLKAAKNGNRAEEKRLMLKLRVLGKLRHMKAIQATAAFKAHGSTDVKPVVMAYPSHKNMRTLLPCVFCGIAYSAAFLPTHRKTVCAFADSSMYPTPREFIQACKAKSLESVFKNAAMRTVLSGMKWDDAYHAMMDDASFKEYIGVLCKKHSADADLVRKKCKWLSQFLLFSQQNSDNTISCIRQMLKLENFEVLSALFVKFSSKCRANIRSLMLELGLALNDMAGERNDGILKADTGRFILNMEDLSPSPAVVAGPKKRGRPRKRLPSETDSDPDYTCIVRSVRS